MDTLTLDEFQRGVEKFKRYAHPTLDSFCINIMSETSLFKLTKVVVFKRTEIEQLLKYRTWTVVNRIRIKGEIVRDIKIMKLEVNGAKYTLDWEMYLKEREYRIVKERPLIPYYLWNMFGLGEGTLNDLRNRLKK